MKKTSILSSMAFALLFTAVGCGDGSMGAMDEADVPVVDEAEIQKEIMNPEAMKHYSPEQIKHMQNMQNNGGGAAQSGQ